MARQSNQRNSGSATPRSTRALCTPHQYRRQQSLRLPSMPLDQPNADYSDNRPPPVSQSRVRCSYDARSPRQVVATHHLNGRASIQHRGFRPHRRGQGHNIDIHDYGDGSQIPSARAHARNFIVPFVDSLTAILATRFMLELEEKGRDRRRSGRSSRAVLPTTQTLVGSEPAEPDSAPASPLTDNSDSGSSLHTLETRSIGWNRVGLCLGAKAF
ncbi:hypothetical protein B0H11DRAFT_1379669 [Mycena galericulata]|nr:hypothetical protein B0H11DRAFT_1379669 [Mycena galericulata]